MKAHIITVLALCVVGVLCRSVEHPNLSLLFPRGKCGVQTGTFPAPLADGNTSPAGLTESPWSALLQYSMPTPSGITAIRHSCSGVLIADRYVLSPAHCVRGYNKKNTGELSHVRLGEYNVKIGSDCVQENGEEHCPDPVVDIEVETIIVHPEYNEPNRSHRHDIALIRLKNVAPYTDYIRPICLPLEDEQTTPGENLVVSGWDLTTKGDFNSIKQKASIPIVAFKDCQIKYQTHKPQLGAGQMCAGGQEGVRCITMAGSPLTAAFPGTADRYVEGFLSLGPRKCALGGIPDVFTRVSNYVPWILDNMKP